MCKVLKFFSMILAVAFFLTMSLRSETAGGAAAETDISGLAKKVYPSVVRVEARNSMHKVATGVVIDEKGHILTTALISPRDEKVTVITGEGKRIDADFLGFDPETYLAVVQAKDKNLPPLAMGDPSRLNAGSWICVISISPEMMPAVTQGIVSSLSEGTMRLNIWVTPGSSGGPVVDEAGRMVGLLRGIYTEDKPVVFEFRDREQVGSGYVFSKGEAPSSGMAMAVPMDIAKKVAQEIIEKGRVSRGWLGVSISQNDQDQLEIINVEKDSPGELAKLKEGDVILQIEGKEINNPKKLSSEIRNRKPGEDITLKIERDGKPVDVKVKLGEYTEAEARHELESRFPRLFPPGMPTHPLFPKGEGVKPPRIKEHFWETRKFVGLYLQELTPELATFFGVKEGKGLLVTKLVDQGPADKAGLKVGDVIVKIEGTPMETVSELSEMIQDKKKGDKIKVEILREKKPLSLEVEISEEKNSDRFSWEPFKEALDSLSGSSEGIRAQMRDWEVRYGPEIRENVKRLNKEIETIARDAKGAGEELRLRLRHRVVNI